MARAAGKQCSNLACPNMQPCPIHSKRNESDREKPAYYKWYYRKRWKTLRASQLRKEPFCQDCLKNGERTTANEVDHHIPHRGDPSLFFDAKNLRSLCKPCHSRKTMKEVME